MTNQPRVYGVYVIKLRKRILRNRSFKKTNPKYRKGRPCVYVGSTAKTPEERFLVHLTDRRRGSAKVRKYGKSLFEWAYSGLPSYSSREEAEAAEAAHAEELRCRGWGVWQK